MDYRMREAIGKAHGFARLDEDGQTAAVEAAELADAARKAYAALDDYMYKLEEFGLYLGCNNGEECGGDADDCAGDCRYEYTKRAPLQFYVSAARARMRGEAVSVFGAYTIA